MPKHPIAFCCGVLSSDARLEASIGVFFLSVPGDRDVFELEIPYRLA
ncbi:MAG: hypothetical protein NNA30_01515 [Nitrospira sp.]|nr:hypothetical protein [Nitrospira sp.]